MDSKFEIPKQDMPPPGGYRGLFWQRTFAKTWFSWKKFLPLFVGVHIYAVYKFRYYKSKARQYVIEQNDVKVALEPFLLAERDRLWLKTTQRLRDEEEELMKNVPGWKTGTWYGEPIYFTIPPDQWWDLSEYEAFFHSREIDQNMWKNFKYIEFASAPRWYDKYLPDWVFDYAN